MADLLKGAAVVEKINEDLINRVNKLNKENISPTLSIVRIGDKPDDISYEKGATKRCEKIGINVKPTHFDLSITQEELIDKIKELNQDDSIHGVLLLRPFPKEFDDNLIRNTLDPKKDIDGITDGSLAGVFASTDTGFPPCTAQACMEILDFYGVDLKGKEVTVVGRSLVVGKPVAIMLLGKHATVTICHTRTVDMPAVCRKAEILIVAAGRAEIVDKTYMSEGQIIVDVGINVDDEGHLKGDVNLEDAKEIVASVTPVPGGVGTVTTSVLAKHVVLAAERTL